jgi:hypothetical protein
MLIFHIPSVNFNFIEKYLIIITHNLISYVFLKKTCVVGTQFDK